MKVYKTICYQPLLRIESYEEKGEEMFHFWLYDEKGNEVDTMYGFSYIEEMKEDLPEEWKDEDLTQYIIS